MEIYPTIMNILAVFLFISLPSTQVAAVGGIFDITRYGARPNSDITLALANTWRDACASPFSSKLIIPRAVYNLKEVTLQGPCKAPIEVQVQGKLVAPVDTSKLTKPDTWIAFRYIDRLTLTGGGVFDGQGAIAWRDNDCNVNPRCKSQTINLRFDFITNSIIRGVTSLNSKNFHVNVLGCKNVLFQHFTVIAPGNSVNTDGIHIGRSTGVNITDSNIGTGDDCISIGDGTTKLRVVNVHCGPGHGISIGSLGKYTNEQPVHGITIKNCTLSNTSNGVRIKTWPASPGATTVSNIHFKNIIMNNVATPIIIDQEYCPWNQCNKKIPSKVKITNVNFMNIRGTSSTPIAVQLLCSRAFPCDRVQMANINLAYRGPGGRVTSQCSSVRPIVTRVPRSLACAART